jgi:hypothetical protein
MRLAASSLLLLSIGSMACTLPAPDFDGGYDEEGTARPIDPTRPTRPTRPTPSPQPTTTSTPTPAPTPAPTPTPTSTHPEVVTVFISDTSGNRWFCTGTLVSSTEVVTAAHCLDPAPKVTFSIVASQLAGKPRFVGLSARAYGGSYEDVANPDIGIITLAQPIVLPSYAELTDVTSQVDAGGVLAKAYVRTAEQPDAPFVFTSELTIASTVEYGYTSGFGTPMFSKGGDSGAGLFLVENGVVTHKLVAVARQPEPSRNLDHFTRIDSGFLAFRAAR